MWIELALLSGLLMGVRRIYEKELTGIFSNFSLGFLQQAFSIPPAAALLLFFPIPAAVASLSWDFWWPLLIIWFVLYPVQTYFFYRSLREGELSDVMPMTALLPVLNVLASFVVIGELPALFGAIGIVLVVLGTYLILLKKSGGPRLVRINKPALFMVVAMASISIGSTLDKVAIQASTPVFYAFVNILGVSAVFFVLVFVFRQHGELKYVREKFNVLLWLGILSGISFAAAMTAFSLAPTSYTLAVRTVGFLVPVAWGIFFLKENISRWKIVALTCITAGILLLAVQ
jgi:drug/metabolite transporter (DMT)-like permease